MIFEHAELSQAQNGFGLTYEFDINYLEIMQQDSAVLLPPLFFNFHLKGSLYIISRY